MTIPVPCTVLRWINVGERPKLHSCEIYGIHTQQRTTMYGFIGLPGMTPLCLHELIRPPIEELRHKSLLIHAVQAIITPFVYIPLKKK